MTASARAPAVVSRFLTTVSLFHYAARLVALVALLAAVPPPPRAYAAPVLGFLEEFNGPTANSWSGGTPFSFPGTGGYLGAGDPYLQLANTVPSAFGIVSFGDEYVGDWTAAGITQVRVWLNDVGNADPLDMHFSIGNGLSDFWQYNIGFHPPLHAWGLYVVPLTGGASWTRIRGSGTFAAALTSVDRIHLRHDPPPFAINPDRPDPIAADAGIDHVLLTNGLVGVDPFEPAVVHPVELAPPYPNPSRGPVSLAVRAPDAGVIRLEIVDLAGRTVRHVELADLGSGPRTWLWDGLDATGRRVPAGYYRVLATGAAGGMSQPLARIN